MASSYSTDLKLELMVTGEDAGIWGDITNTNLVILQQSISGYSSITLNATTGSTLTFTNGLPSNGKNAVLNLTGTITSNVSVIVPDGIGKTYIIRNSTTGAYTVQIKTTSGTGPTFAATDKGFKLVYSNGTDIIDVSLASPPGGSNTQIQFNSGGTAFGGSANLIWDGTNVVIDSEGALRLGDATGSGYVGLKAPTTITGDTPYTLTLPVSTGSANQVLQTDGSGNLSFATVSGGAAWQAVTTSTTFTAVSKQGYFINTSAAAITATLPASPTLGDFISFVDYAGTFDTNNLTVARNGNPIQGSATDLTVATERAGFTLVYVDATQGWLLQNN
jgi:hypothetical protein